MKQLLLRVPERLHRRIAARAEREGRSINATAQTILDAAADADLADPQAALRAQAQRAGVLREVPAEPLGEGERERIIASTKGTGPIVDDAITADRERS